MGKMFEIGRHFYDRPSIVVPIGNDTKLLKVDNRKSVVFQISKIGEDESLTEEQQIDKTLSLLLGEDKYKEINEADIPFPALQELFKLAVMAATGEESMP